MKRIKSTLEVPKEGHSLAIVTGGPVNIVEGLYERADNFDGDGNIASLLAK